MISCHRNVDEEEEEEEEEEEGFIWHPHKTSSYKVLFVNWIDCQDPSLRFYKNRYHKGPRYVTNMVFNSAHQLFGKSCTDSIDFRK